jgi:hypothetical protein
MKSILSIFLVTIIFACSKKSKNDPPPSTENVKPTNPSFAFSNITYSCKEIKFGAGASRSCETYQKLKECLRKLTEDNCIGGTVVEKNCANGAPCDRRVPNYERCEVECPAVDGHRPKTLEERMAEEQMALALPNIDIDPVKGTCTQRVPTGYFTCDGRIPEEVIKASPTVFKE